MNTRRKQIIRDGEHLGLQIRIIEPIDRTFASVYILNNGVEKGRFEAKRGDAEKQAREYIETLH